MASRSGSSLKDVLHSTAGRIGFVAVNSITGMITARTLHPAGRGELAALGVWPNFLGGLLTFGLPSALIFWSRRHPDQQSSFLWAALPLALVAGALAAVTGMLGIPYWLAQYSPYVIHMAQLFMFNVFVVLMIAVARAACESEGDFLASSVALVMPSVVALCGLLVLCALHRLTPVTGAIAYILSGVPACFFLLLRLWQWFQRPPSDIVKRSRQLLGYGIRSYGVDICGTLSIYADQAIVIQLLNPEAMGTYVVALSLSRVIGVVHLSVAAVLFPKAVALKPHDLIATTGRAVRISTFCSFIAGVGIALFGPALLSLFYGREYRGATGMLNVLILEMIVSGATLVLTRPHMAMGRPGAVTILQSSGLALSIPLLLLLVPRFGVMGASYALLAASTLRFLLCLASFRLVLRIGMPGLRLRSSDFSALANRVLSMSKRNSEAETLGA
jgi:O-antigen/teichoic acid export membrane protein